MKKPKKSLTHGGSAALLGFLYQLQATATRLLEVHLEGSGANAATDGVLVILEPDGGGDAIIQAGARHCIQLKMRSQVIDAGTLATSVLPDLFGAHCETACDRYEFQSNQRLSKPAADLFSLLDGTRTTTAPVQSDYQRARKSCRTVYLKRRGGAAGFAVEFRKFCSRLHLANPVSVTALRARLAQHLLPHLPYADQIGAKLDQLAGDLMTRAIESGTVLTGPMMAEALGLAIVTDAQLRLDTALKTALDARRYDVAYDVRPPLSVTVSAPLTLVAGPSGNGKSWALCRLAQDAIEARRPALLIRAADRAELEREMKRVIAIDTLNHDSPIDSSALGKLWRRQTGNDDADILVLWEGCGNAEELKKVFYQNGLGDGLMLMAELPPDADASAFREIGVLPHEVGEFGEAQLFDALNRRGVQAGAVPADIRRMLRHPVLCGIYATLAIESGGWNPANEYIVLGKFWHRARERAGQTTGARLKALAQKMVEKSATEATDSEVVALGFTDDQLGQLVASGWLAEVSGKWRFAHDRLLTWAIAEWLAERLSQASVGAEEVASCIECLGNDSPQDRSRLHGLGFLMMDVVWLASSGTAPSTKVAELLSLLEDDRQHRSSQNFYRDLCPTIGSAILEGLLARAALITDRDRDIGLAGNIVAAILALNLPPAERDRVSRQLAQGDDRAWKLLLLLGSEWPLTTERERLWEGLVEAYRKVGTEQRNFARFERYREAALCLSRTDPNWLEAKILSTTDAKALGIATILLREIAPAPRQDQWARISHHLFEHMDEDNHSRLVGFIQRTNDRSRLPFLVHQIERATHCAPDAFAALARMDPIKATEMIVAKPAVRYPPQTGIWLSRMLDQHPLQVRHLIDNWLMHVDPTGCMLATFWAGAKCEVGLETLAILLQRLDAELAQAGGGDERQARILLGVLGSGSLNPANDRAFHAMRGSRLAHNLRIRLEGHARGAQNALAGNIWTLLLRIGGSDLDAYVIALLDGPFGDRGPGVNAAIFTATPGVVRRLEAMAVDWSTPYTEPVRPAVWRLLVGLKPDVWYPRMLNLLTGGSDLERSLGLELFDDLGFAEDAGVLVDCVRLTQPGSATEARAINLAIYYGANDPLLLERALPRFRKDKDAEGHLAACNVLLQERGSPARAKLDAFLMTLSSQTSWTSTDLDVLAVRLHQDDVSDELLAAAEPFMRRRSLFGEQLIDPYLQRGHRGVQDMVLERAFAPPNIMTNELPDMINALARIDVAQAEQAFEQAWQENPERQRYLAPCSAGLGARALQAMLKSLPSKDGGRDAKIAFRAMCIELRGRHHEALPLIHARYATAAKPDRELLVKVISWMPEAEAELQKIFAEERDPDIGDLAEELLILHRCRVSAVEAYRAEPASIPRLLYAIEIVDPELLYRVKDRWSISELIHADGQQTIIAEDAFVRRFNKVENTRYKRVRIRKRMRAPAASLDETSFE
ncbi:MULTISPECIES: hypothetical protein [unclassified Novosphingobium]|uniref:hypothetical protein n=1 Tax=unclassified Novosphingobium TaxID=2644732 RepID=UPI00146E79EE|nr:MULTISPECIES: hypothetical protein [unclassified Novosphingobium]NMN05444.1 hypothetical protein [Novosphingobium sp. SG919]NMN88197.1 hypothetical protein [Novosphingobium sp. SG916]